MLHTLAGALFITIGLCCCITPIIDHARRALFPASGWVTVMGIVFIGIGIGLLSRQG